MTQKKPYSATIGVYVRVYCQFNFEAENDEAATQAAIEKFKSDAGDVHFYDTDWDNKALPSIASIYAADNGNQTIAEGVDFSISAEDARDYAAGEMLSVLGEFLTQNSGDPEDLLAGDDPMRAVYVRARAAIAKAKAV